MRKYRIYVDEVGNPDLRSSENFEHRFLCLTGVILDHEKFFRYNGKIYGYGAKKLP